uniref:Zinc transporter ZIP5 n=1 Tax=Laticauda laticaudata TaxID=8630 RepID=A0A8C5SSS9_LATLA
SGEPHDLPAGGVAGPLLEDATQEQGYYLKQLFQQYGENGTLSFEGLTRLLLNLGLGKVQVVEIEHEELGHGHVSHLDILEVQENKHLHSHSALDHLSRTENGAEAQGEIHNKQPSGLFFFLQCLNVSQLLVNFGMNTISKITPEQFTLLCPALLYQIDSRVCIQHLDDVTFDIAGNSLWIVIRLIHSANVSFWTHVPSALAIILVPLLSREIFQFLLTFLVALAVGTLCGDALLHLWPHAQVSSHGLLSSEEDGILKGLCVLGGIYFLFLTENLMGTLNQIRAKRVRSAGKAWIMTLQGGKSHVYICLIRVKQAKMYYMLRFPLEREKTFLNHGHVTLLPCTTRRQILWHH